MVKASTYIFLYYIQLYKQMNKPDTESITMLLAQLLF